MLAFCCVGCWYLVVCVDGVGVCLCFLWSGGLDELVCFVFGCRLLYVCWVLRVELLI